MRRKILFSLILLIPLSRIYAATTSNGFEIKSYKVNNDEKVIYQINNGTFAKTLLINTSNIGSREILDLNGSNKNNNTRLATGYSIKLTNNNVTINYKLSIVGDVVGDGNITLDDAKKVTKHIVGNSSITGYEYLHAADYNGNGTIKMDDVMQMLNEKKKYISSSEMESTTLVTKNTGNYYAYAPSVVVENGNTHVFYCKNKTNGETIDHIYYTKNAGTDQKLILAPLSGSWDSYHICDPSVVEGKFTYNNNNYKYAMAYLGINTSTCLGNDIGLAVSNSLDSGWTRVGNSPIVSYDNTDRWGVGQPSLIYINNKLIMFYTNDTGVGSGMQVMIINPETMSIETSGNLSSKNTNWMHNADFAIKDNRLYIVYEGDEAATTGDIISDTLQIKSAYISNYTNITEYKNLIWEDENIISSDVSGYRRNTNGGFFRTPNGELASRTVAYTSTTQGSGTGHYTYQIYKSNF